MSNIETPTILEVVLVAFAKSVEGVLIKPESTFEELGLDSLDVIYALMPVEEELGISIGINAMEGFKCVQDVITYIEKGSIEDRVSKL